MSRKVKYLTDKEALQLGLKLNKKQGKRTKARYRLSDKQWSIVYENRIELKERNFVETIKKYGKGGELISTTEKLQSEPIEAPDGFRDNKSIYFQNNRATMGTIRKEKRK